MEPQVQPSGVSQEAIGIDLSDITLDDLEQLDDSVLAHALRRFHRETNGPEGAVAHNSTTHDSSHSSSPW